MQSAVNVTPSGRRWLLLVLAIPIGVLGNRLLGGWDSLPQAVMTLAGWLNEPTYAQRHAARLVSSLLVPGALAFLILSLTPIGAWLVPNRLAVAGLVAANAILAAVAVVGLYLASLGEPAYLRGALGDVVGVLLSIAFVVGLGSLCLSTVWHRLLKDSPCAVAFLKSLARPV